MLQALAEHRVCAMKVSAREGFFQGRGANQDAIEFNAGSRRIAGDLDGFRGRGSNEAKK
jgi:hypothetical protein